MYNGDRHHEYENPVIRISPKGDVVVGACYRGKKDELRWWDAATGDVLGRAPLRNGEVVQSLVFAADWRTFVTSHSTAEPGEIHDQIRGCCLWDTTARTLVKRIDFPKGWRVGLRGVFACPTAGLLFCAVDTDGSIAIHGLDLRTGARVVGPLTHPRPPSGASEPPILQVEPTPDGRLLVTFSFDRQLRVWDLRTGRLLGRPTRAEASGVWPRSSGFSIHPGGRRVMAAGGYGSGIQEWALPRETTEAPAAVTRRLEALTGLRLDADGEAHALPVAPR